MRKAMVVASVLACGLLGGAVAAASAGGVVAVAAAGTATGAVTGAVTFAGEAPAGVPVQMAADPFCSAAHPEPVVARSVRVDAEGRLADVVVWVRDAPAGPAAGSPALLDQEGCLYLPHVLAVRAGQTVVFRNSDMTLHNINVQPARNPGFNVGQPIRGMQIERQFDNPEVGIPVRCDVHPWMTGYLAVFGHGAFAVTGDDGSFRIEGLPAGDWVIEAWHESLGARTMEVSVGDGETVTADVEYSG